MCISKKTFRKCSVIVPFLNYVFVKIICQQWRNARGGAERKKVREKKNEKKRKEKKKKMKK